MFLISCFDSSSFRIRTTGFPPEAGLIKTLTLKTFTQFFGVEVSESGVLELNGRLFQTGIWSFN